MAGRSTKNLQPASFKAGADLSAKKNFIVKRTADNTVGLASAATDVLLGVLTNSPKSGDGAAVALVGSGQIALVVAGGSISADAVLTADSAGKAIATTTTGNYILGRAMNDADAGDLVEVLLVNHARYAATA